MNDKFSPATVPATDSMEAIQAHIANWADRVFPDRTAYGSLAKLMCEEIPEFISSGMDDPDEYADLVIMILDIGYLKGIEVSPAVLKKLARNERRTWSIDPNTGFLKHTSEGE